MEWWNEVVFAGTEVTWGQIIILLGWVIGAMLLGKLVQLLLGNVGKQKRLEERQIVQVTLKALGRPMPFLFFAVGLKVGLHQQFDGEMIPIIADVFAVLFTFAVTFFIYSLVDVQIGRAHV